jgi:hypothetical protein
LRIGLRIGLALRDVIGLEEIASAIIFALSSLSASWKAVRMDFLSLLQAD